MFSPSLLSLIDFNSYYNRTRQFWYLLWQHKQMGMPQTSFIKEMIGEQRSFRKLLLVNSHVKLLETSISGSKTFWTCLEWEKLTHTRTRLQQNLLHTQLTRSHTESSTHTYMTLYVDFYSAYNILIQDTSENMKWQFGTIYKLKLFNLKSPNLLTESQQTNKKSSCRVLCFNVNNGWTWPICVNRFPLLALHLESTFKFVVKCLPAKCTGHSVFLF